ncbi:MAG: PorT family protein [Bacteroidales bacterium]|nr:PorT family protein [Bacteroidales bacterium]MCF8403760.1 PorT family protein [Bacteroidales bacterium]
MKEKFEHKITERIKETFTSHAVEYNPQDWEKMKSMLPTEKKKGAILFWNIAKAAAVVLFLLGSAYFLWDIQMNKPESIVEKDVNYDSPKTLQEPVVQDRDITLDKNLNTNNTHNINQQSIVTHEEEAKRPDTFNKTPENNSKVITSNPKPLMGTHLNNLPFTDTLIAISDKLIDSGTEVAEMPVLGQSSVKIEIPDTNNSLAKEPPFIPYTDPILKKQKIKFGVELASFTNYTENLQTPSMNYGGGIAAHIPIKNRFSFNPGINLSNMQMQMNGSSDLLSNADFTTASTYGVEEITNNYSEIKPNEIQLTGLDLPLNFQYQFLQRNKGNYFLELGFSSLLYLSENYTYNLSYIDNSGCPPGTACGDLKTVSQEYDEPAFKTFDFAKLLNFSVGMDYHLNKRFDMVVNPFFKYPVSALSSSEIKFGSGGLKLKFMLLPKK